MGCYKRFNVADLQGQLHDSQQCQAQLMTTLEEEGPRWQPKQRHETSNCNTNGKHMSP